MDAPGVVKGEVPRQRALRVVPVRVAAQIDLFVLHAPLQPFDEDVVDPATLAIHADRHAPGLQRREPLLAGELRALLHSEPWVPVVEVCRPWISPSSFLISVIEFFTAAQSHRAQRGEKKPLGWSEGWFGLFGRISAPFLAFLFGVGKIGCV